MTGPRTLAAGEHPIPLSADGPALRRTRGAVEHRIPDRPTWTENSA